jgi:hypothetical protein
MDSAPFIPFFAAAAAVLTCAFVATLFQNILPEWKILIQPDSRYQLTHPDGKSQNKE